MFIPVSKKIGPKKRDLRSAMATSDAACQYVAASANPPNGEALLKQGDPTTQGWFMFTVDGFMVGKPVYRPRSLDPESLKALPPEKFFRKSEMELGNPSFLRLCMMAQYTEAMQSSVDILGMSSDEVREELMSQCLKALSAARAQEVPHAEESEIKNKADEPPEEEKDLEKEKGLVEEKDLEKEKDLEAKKDLEEKQDLEAKKDLKEKQDLEEKKDLDLEGKGEKMPEPDIKENEDEEIEVEPMKVLPPKERLGPCVMIPLPPRAHEPVVVPAPVVVPPRLIPEKELKRTHDEADDGARSPPLTVFNAPRKKIKAGAAAGPRPPSTPPPWYLLMTQKVWNPAKHRFDGEWSPIFQHCLGKRYILKKQDEAHEPECQHVCWETKT